MNWNSFKEWWNNPYAYNEMDKLLIVLFVLLGIAAVVVFCEVRFYNRAKKRLLDNVKIPKREAKD